MAVKMRVSAPMQGGPIHQAPIHLGSDSPKLMFSCGLTYMLQALIELCSHPVEMAVFTKREHACSYWPMYVCKLELNNTAP